jgi:hypothetical protein
MMKRFIRVAMLLCMGTVLLSALSFKTIEAKAATASGKVFQNRFSSTSCGKWSAVPSPNSNIVPNGLSAVATVSANDVWAVGSSGSQMSGGQTLIEHWDGAHWQIVKSPSPGTRYNTLNGVTAVSVANVWAVGYYVNASQVTQTLVEHWNGKLWSVVKSPSPASVNNELFSVAAVSAGNVWAVGFSTTNTSDQTLIEHWNGSNWSVVKSPSPGSGDDLRGVAAVSASNVWATGYTFNGSSIQTLVEHWNGTSWQVVKSPNVGTSPALWGVAAVSANDVWAVGSDSNSNNVTRSLTEQWNGNQWSVVNSPSPGSFNTQLLGVAAVSANNVWAVGHADSNTLIEHFHC